MKITKISKNLLILRVLCFTIITACTMCHSFAVIYFHYDFAGSGNFDFDYGTWTGNVTPGASYITIDTGANGTNGGAGFNLTSVDLTLTPPANTYMVIRARLLPTHNGTSINLVLNTTPTDYTVWAIPASSFNTTTFTTVLVPLNTTPVFTGGAGVTLTNVNSYQVQGNYSNMADFDIEVEFMSIIPEPHEVAEVVLLALGLILVILRRPVRARLN